jgi:hypothetical protein
MVFTVSFKSVLLYYVSMVSLADKFAAALNDDLSGTDLSEGLMRPWALRVFWFPRKQTQHR